VSLIRGLKESKEEVSYPIFTSSDIEFLISLIEHTTFQGSQTKQVYGMLCKLAELHRKLIKENINANESK